MTGDCRLSKEAAKQLRRLPRDHQEQLGQAIEEMRDDPLRGDVLPIKSGKFKGVLRKRVGRHRIIFALDTQNRLVEIAAVLIRTEKIYQ